MRNEEWWCGAHTMKALRIMESRKMRRPLEKGQAEGQG